MTRRLRAATAAGLLVLATLVACTPSDPEAAESGGDDCSVQPDSGEVAHPVVVDGDERTYRVYAPDDVPPGTRLPVVYLFHPLGVSAEAAAPYTGLPAAGQEHGFIVVAPESGPVLAWDFLTPSTTPGSDLAFAKAVVTQVPERHCGDEARQYVAGMSNGSAMTFAVACDGGFPAQAYAGVAAIGYAATCVDAPPTSFLYIHGTGDDVVPFEGGQTPVGPTAPAAQSLSAWAQHSDCPPEPRTSAVGDDVESWTWECPEARMEVYVIAGGGHTWPGAVPIDGLGQTSETIDATELIVEFFGLDR